MAVPRRLDDRFPVDQHAEVTIGALDFRTMGSYLSLGYTLSALEPFLRYHQPNAGPDFMPTGVAPI